MRTVILLSMSVLGFSGTAFAGTATTAERTAPVATTPTTRMPATTKPAVTNRPTATAPDNTSGAPESDERPMQPTVPTADAPIPSSGSGGSTSVGGGGRADQPIQPTVPTADEPIPSSGTGGSTTAGGGTDRHSEALPSTTTSDTTRRVGGAKRTKKKKKKKRKGFKIDEYNPLYGTLVFGPKPEFHDKYTNAGNKKKSTVVKKKHLPERDVNRKNSLAAGVRAGTLMHGYTDGSSHSDMGLGVMMRYRPTEAVGLQLDLTHHADQLLGTERGQTLLSGSGQVFVFPWNTMSPYALVGITSNGRGGIPGLGEQQDNMTGAHVGAGLEIGLGKSMAVDIEARYIGWLGQDQNELSNPGAVQANAGLVFHF